MISCQNCGELTKDDIQIYKDSLRKQSFDISPILPTCKYCGAEAAVTQLAEGGHIVVLNGTCGSGKSTIAEIFTQKGYLAIDGDCVIQVVRHKNKRKKYEWNELIEEIACEIDILSLFSMNIVLSHVILPEDLDKYIDMFETRQMNYHFFLLEPEYQTAVQRCQARTCHTSITPEYWIKHFFDLLNFDSRVIIVDNTSMTAEETAQYILERSGKVEADV